MLRRKPEAKLTRITRVESFVYRAPITAPIKTSFGTMPDRATLLIRIEDASGVAGWGEVWVNFPSVGAEYRARLFDSVLAKHLLGRDVNTAARSFWAEMDRALQIHGIQAGEPGAFAAVLAGADIALNDLAARHAGVPLWRYWGGSDGSPVGVYASGIDPGSSALDMVEASRRQGFRAFKIKIGFGNEQDLKTLEPVVDRLGNDERLMVDANQAWDVAAACRMAVALKDFRLSWLEEPLRADRPAWEWAQVKAAAAAPLAGGENLRGSLVFQQILADGYLSVVQPDMCKWGGFSGTVPVGRSIVAAGKVFCPHYLASGVGLIASVHLLAAVRGEGSVEVDVNPNPLREELLRNVLRIENGVVRLPASSGVGFDPDLAPFADLQTLHTETRA
jgi:D-galactarolactone cycloisomerase